MLPIIFISFDGFDNTFLSKKLYPIPLRLKSIKKANFLCSHVKEKPKKMYFSWLLWNGSLKDILLLYYS